MYGFYWFLITLYKYTSEPWQSWTMQGRRFGPSIIQVELHIRPQVFGDASPSSHQARHKITQQWKEISDNLGMFQKYELSKSSEHVSSRRKPPCTLGILDLKPRPHLWICVNSRWKPMWHQLQNLNHMITSDTSYTSFEGVLRTFN